MIGGLLFAMALLYAVFINLSSVFIKIFEKFLEVHKSIKFQEISGIQRGGSYEKEGDR